MMYCPQEHPRMHSQYGCKSKRALEDHCFVLVAFDSHDNVAERFLILCSYPHTEFRCDPVIDTDVPVIEEDAYR